MWLDDTTRETTLLSFNLFVHYTRFLFFYLQNWKKTTPHSILYRYLPNLHINTISTFLCTHSCYLKKINSDICINASFQPPNSINTYILLIMVNRFAYSDSLSIEIYVLHTILNIGHKIVIYTIDFATTTHCVLYVYVHYCGIHFSFCQIIYRKCFKISHGPIVIVFHKIEF